MIWSYPEVALRDLRDSYDYIIVGGGTAGCVLANRLSRNPAISVLVLERGSVTNNWLSSVPLFSQHHASDGSLSRVWKSTPQKHLGNREMELVTGIALGGGTRVNAMLYTRGLPGEFNSWAEEGRKGWSYDDMQQYFVRSETDLDQDPNNPQDFHGVSGEWQNRSFKEPYWNHTKDVVQATTALGVPYVDDLNSPLHPSHGCAKMHFAVDSQGRRSSTFTAFLPASLVKERKENLHICTRVVVTRLEMSKRDRDLTAEGVWVQANSEDATPRLVRAKREVILAAGPLSSPQILMLSGIGPEKHLKEHGIKVLKDLPGVGSHLQDHLAVPLQYCIPWGESVNDLKLRPWLIIKHLLLYLLFGTGLFLGQVLELSIFIQSRLLTADMRVETPSKADVDAARPQNLPDIESMVLATSPAALLTRQGGMAFYNAILRPKSTGTVRLSSPNPLVNPLIDPNYLSDPSDLLVMRKALRFAHRVKEQMASSGYPISDIPGLHPILTDDTALDAYIRAECASALHYTSTCRMAPEAAPSYGVVDDQLRVHGVERLRVADSSIFPWMLATHLAAPTVAVAEKCADMVEWDSMVKERGNKSESSMSVTANGH